MKYLITAAALLAGLAAIPAPADASVTLGSNLARSPNSYIFGYGDINTDVSGIGNNAVQLSAPDGTQFGPSTAPSDGVITKWSIKFGTIPTDTTAARVTPRLMRGTVGGPLGSEVNLLSLAPGVYTFATRIPTNAGDSFAIEQWLACHCFNTGAHVPIAHAETGAGSYHRWGGPIADGEAPSFAGQDFSDLELLANAVLEPDADKDGYGDESQDQCATQGTTQGACVAAPVPIAPKLSLSGSKKQKVGRTFKVLAACDRQCSLSATGNVAIGKGRKPKKFNFGAAKGSGAAGSIVTLKPTLSKKMQRAIKKALRRHTKLRGELKVAATSGGATTGTQSLKISFKR